MLLNSTSDNRSRLYVEGGAITEYMIYKGDTKLSVTQQAYQVEWITDYFKQMVKVVFLQPLK